MNFKVSSLNQGELGSLFGVSSHEAGKWLVKIGLRDERTKRPTTEAHRVGYTSQVPGGSNYSWEWTPSVVAALREAGHQMVLELPLDLVEPSPLCGPFSISAKDGRNILDGEGNVTLRTASKRNSEALLRLLGVAEKTGALKRLVEGTSTLPN